MRPTSPYPLSHWRSSSGFMAVSMMVLVMVLASSVVAGLYMRYARVDVESIYSEERSTFTVARQLELMVHDSVQRVAGQRRLAEGTTSDMATEFVARLPKLKQSTKSSVKSVGSVPTPPALKFFPMKDYEDSGGKEMDEDEIPYGPLGGLIYQGSYAANEDTKDDHEDVWSFEHYHDDDKLADITVTSQYYAVPLIDHKLIAYNFPPELGGSRPLTAPSLGAFGFRGLVSTQFVTTALGGEITDPIAAVGATQAMAGYRHQLQLTEEVAQYLFKGNYLDQLKAHENAILFDFDNLDIDDELLVYSEKSGLKIDLDLYEEESILYLYNAQQAATPVRIGDSSKPDYDHLEKPMIVVLDGRSMNGSQAFHLRFERLLSRPVLFYLANTILDFVPSQDVYLDILDDGSDPDLIDDMSDAMGLGDETTGLVGGHMDVDTSSFIAEIDSGKTDAHVHEYDDKYNVTGVNFLDFEGSSLDDLGTLISADTKFKIIVGNADLSPGARLVINRNYNHKNSNSYTLATDYDDIDLKDLEIYSLSGNNGATQLSTFELYFDLNAIPDGGLHPTNTGAVKKNTLGPNKEWRNGALTIQAVAIEDNWDEDKKKSKPDKDAFSTSQTYSAGGVQGVATSGLLWESTQFWHYHGPDYGEDGWNERDEDDEDEEAEADPDKKKKKDEDPAPDLGAELGVDKNGYPIGAMMGAFFLDHRSTLVADDVIPVNNRVIYGSLMAPASLLSGSFAGYSNNPLPVLPYVEDDDFYKDLKELAPRALLVKTKAEIKPVKRDTKVIVQ